MGSRPPQGTRTGSTGRARARGASAVAQAVEEVDEPKITSPFDVIVRVGGAGLCRTDLHIIEGQFKTREQANLQLPYTLGHENAGGLRRLARANRRYSEWQRCGISSVE